MTKTISKNALQAEAARSAPPVSNMPAAEAAGETGKRQRVRRPFGQHRQKLALEPRAGFHTHWFNDEPGRVDRAKEGGYEHRLDSKGDPVCRVVGVGEGGQPLKAYAMDIPEEFFEEDMQEQADRVNETDRAIHQGLFNTQQGDGRYIPSRGITIRTTGR